MSSPHWALEFRPAVARAMRKSPRDMNVRIRLALEDLSADPRRQGARQLVGSDGEYRLRVGDYRIIYEIDDKNVVILVLSVGHRREIHRRR